MKNTFAINFFLLLVPILIFAQDVNEVDSEPQNMLIGEWVIDLRPTPNSEEYFQTFLVESIDENKLQGTFYGSNIKNGLINKNWEKLFFAFTTSDQSNEYYHSGYLLDGMLFGLTYCPNRNFTAPWTGKTN